MARAPSRFGHIAACALATACPGESGDSGSDSAAVIEPDWVWEGHVAVEVAAGDYNLCALDSDGIWHCFGKQSSIGLDEVPPGLVAPVDVGQWHACGFAADRSLLCWGCGEALTGDGPRAVDFGQCDPPPGVFTDVSSGNTGACGIGQDGDVQCWGAWATADPITDGVFQGDFIDVSISSAFAVVDAGGTLTSYASDETIAVPPTPGFLSVEAGNEVVCAMRPDGTAVCWGSLAGVEDFPPGPVTQLDAGTYAACSIDAADGTLACIGAFVEEYPPPSGRYTAVSVGENNAYAIRDDGVLVGWGVLDEPYVED